MFLQAPGFTNMNVASIQKLAAQKPTESMAVVSLILGARSEWELNSED
jgi:hypothetical protein